MIFERVKEEIRAGRSIRSGIATGYKKGLTAIIDANVVTIMTAFILFVLATAEVQGFAFTLGIGTIVSLFTAVLATQAILTTMGDSRTIARPSALGVGAKKRAWRFDFMGASRYFFSMSGVILLIGALAIGGRGLNLGIDFTSGTRITASLQRPTTATQVAAIVSSAGAKNPLVQKVGNKGEDFQISSKQLQPAGVTNVKEALNSRYGVRTFDNQSVGPTFGKTIANSAVIAIIASLLVISAYVALRFEWKFAIPVLIALMHDLLITAGVYALDREGGDGRHGRGPADHLGLLALRHDHRVRPRAREHPPDAAGGVLADRQPLDVRGADPVDRDHVVHAAADHRAVAVRRLDAQGLRVRADDRRRVGRLLVDLHRLPGADPLEGARGDVSPPPHPDRVRARRGPALRGRAAAMSSPHASARAGAPAGSPSPSPTASPRPSSSS